MTREEENKAIRKTRDSYDRILKDSMASFMKQEAEAIEKAIAEWKEEYGRYPEYTWVSFPDILPVGGEGARFTIRAHVHCGDSLPSDLRSHTRVIHHSGALNTGEGS